MNSKLELTTKELYAISTGTSLSLDPFVPCIIASWVGFTMSEEFRSVLNKGIELIEEKIKTYNKLGWISDFRQGKMVADEDVRWAAESWNIRAHKAGLRYNALIIPENTFLKIGAGEYTETTEKAGDITLRQFSDLELAKNWLSEALNN